MDINKYIKKEAYVTRDPYPDAWRNHPNGSIIGHYSDIIKGNVFDFGCNHGACSFLLCDNPNVKKVIGFDLNPLAIELANQTKDDLKIKNIDFVCGNVCEYDFNDNFDTIVTFHALEHLFPEDLSDVIKRFYSLLNVNGCLIVSIPNGHCYDGPEHVNYFNVNDLASAFERENFKTIECFVDERWSEKCIITGIFQKKNRL